MKNRKYRVSFNSPVILGFVIICTVSLLLGWLSGNITTQLLFSVYRSSFTDPFTYFRFIGHIFGHADFSHFIGNMMMILVVGPLLEEKYGAKVIIFVMLSTALITGFIHFLIFPNVMLLGASGIVFAFILLASVTRIQHGEIPLTLIIVAILYLGEQIYQGIFLSDNVSNLTHIIGGLVGATIGMLATRNKATEA